MEEKVIDDLEIMKKDKKYLNLFRNSRHTNLSTMLIKQKYICNYCMKEFNESFRCSRCKKAYYCGKECQVKDWTIHKILCN